jgi:acetone carboxylase alpha subunit
MTRGIGYGGKTLKSMLEESERLFRETGCYYGLAGDLPLKSKDPMKWEEALYKLQSAVVTAREVCVHIAASPITRSINETCFALFTPEGDAVVLSTGIIVHVHTMSEDIKWMIRNGYEEKPGIKEGDIFSSNDPALGNVHTTDVHTIIPIFYNGELIGWAGGVTHQVDIGAIVPGHDITASTSRFEDGLYMTAEKIAENDILNKHYYERSRRGVRTPLYYDLDEKARIAGIYMIKRFVLDFIKEYGIDYYMQFIREVIEQSRRHFIARIKERTVPGRIRGVYLTITPFAEEAWQPHARRDWVHHLPLEVRIEKDGRVVLNFEGGSGPGPWPWNTAFASLQGALWVVLTQLIGYGEVINEGFNLALKIEYSPGTWMSSDHIYYLSRQVPWYLTIPIFNGLYQNFMRTFIARGYIEEGASGYGFTADPVQGGGFLSGKAIEPAGFYFPIATFEISCIGLGANMARDGIDWGYAMWNPESDMNDAEDWERIQRGFRYLSGRLVKPNTAGYGRRRGGSGWQYMAMFYGITEAVAFNIHPPPGGTFLGYPNATPYSLHVYDTNMEEIIGKKLPYPLGDDPDNPEAELLVKGKFERLPYCTTYPRKFKEYDLFYVKFDGGPGFGDPLERPYELCEKDANDGIYTERILRDVFGCIVRKEGDTYVVDREASEKRRKEIREQRKVRSMDFKEFYMLNRQKLLGKLPEPVRYMYKEVISLSKKWGSEFIEFWQLPKDWVSRL